MWLDHKTRIALIDVLGAVFCLWERREATNDCRVPPLVDSETVQSALVKGISSIDDVSDLVTLARTLAEEADAELHLDRVPTDANPAESRGAVEVDPDSPLAWATKDTKFMDTH